MMQSHKTSLCGSPRAFNTSTAFATTTDNSQYLHAQSSGRETDLRQPASINKFDFRKRNSSVIEVPSSFRNKRGGSTIKERPDLGGSRFGVATLPKVKLAPSSGNRGASFMDLSSIDVKSGGINQGSGKHSGYSLTL